MFRSTIYKICVSALTVALVIGVVAGGAARAQDQIGGVPGEWLSRYLGARTAGMGGAFVAVSDEALGVLLAHDWPGNVRELENIIELAVVLSEGQTIEASDPKPATASIMRIAGGRLKNFIITEFMLVISAAFRAVPG